MNSPFISDLSSMTKVILKVMSSSNRLLLKKNLTLISEGYFNARIYAILNCKIFMLFTYKMDGSHLKILIFPTLISSREITRIYKPTTFV